MNHFVKTPIRLLLALSLTVAFVGCKKGSQPDDPQPVAVPTIARIEPLTALPGGTVTITGTNFDPNPANNTVTIGGVPVVVSSATATSLVVTVPEGVQPGPVVVKVGNQTVQSAESFVLAPKPLKPVVEVQGTTFANLVWTSDKIYLLRGMVYIPADFTLYVEPGTVIKGAGPELDPSGRGATGTLVVERRAKIIAVGTASKPIVFTSAKPAGQRRPGDWGGVVLSGKSPYNRPGSQTFAGGVRGLTETYSEPFDNSGSLEHVRIEFAGSPLPASPDNRLAGLTLYGVGSTTIVNHVQVSQCSGDAFGWYGGTVNAKYLVAFGNAADDWATNWGYSGKVQFGLALRDAALASASGANGFDSQNFDPGENPDGSVGKLNGAPLTAPVFANVSNLVYGTTPPAPGTYGAGLFLRRNTAISVYNSLVFGYPEGLRLEGSATGTAANVESGRLDLRGLVLANVPTPVVGGEAITTEQATAFFTASGRSNQVVADAASLGLNPAAFSLTAPNFLPQSGSPLLTGAVTGDKLADAFFTQVPFRGAFGTENWTAGWTNFNPQEAEYDR